MLDEAATVDPDYPVVGDAMLVQNTDADVTAFIRGEDATAVAVVPSDEGRVEEAALMVTEGVDDGALVPAMDPATEFWVSPAGQQLRHHLLAVQRAEASRRVDLEVGEERRRQRRIEECCGLMRGDVEQDDEQTGGTGAVYVDPDEISAKQLQIHAATSGCIRCPAVRLGQYLQHASKRQAAALLQTKYGDLVTRQYLRDARWLDYTFRRMELVILDEQDMRSRIEEEATHETAPFALVGLQLDLLVLQGTEGTPVHVEEVEREVRFRVIIYDEIRAREGLAAAKDDDYTIQFGKQSARYEEERLERERLVAEQSFARYLVEKESDELLVAGILAEELEMRRRLLVLLLWSAVMAESSCRDAIMAEELLARTGDDPVAAQLYDDDLVAWEVRGAGESQRPVPRQPLRVAPPGSVALAIDVYWQTFDDAFAGERRRREEVLAFQTLGVIGPKADEDEHDKEKEAILSQVGPPPQLAPVVVVGEKYGYEGSNDRFFYEWRDASTGYIEMFGHLVGSTKPLHMPMPYLSASHWSSSHPVRQPQRRGSATSDDNDSESSGTSIPRSRLASRENNGSFAGGHAATAAAAAASTVSGSDDGGRKRATPSSSSRQRRRSNPTTPSRGAPGSSSNTRKQPHGTSRGSSRSANTAGGAAAEDHGTVDPMGDGNDDDDTLLALPSDAVPADVASADSLLARRERLAAKWSQ